MVVSILPVYLMFQAQASPAAIGLIEGLYQGSPSLVRLASAVVIDRLRRYKELAIAGYAASAFAKLGFLLNNEMDDFAPKPGEANAYGLVQGESNAIQPNKHPLSSMAPTLIVRDGKFYLTLGSPGGPTIINTVLQVIVNVLDFKMNLQRAVDWPRIHHQWLPDELRMETGFSPDTVELLKSWGHKIKTVTSQGEVAAILSDGKWLQGAADGRTEGTAKGF